MEPLRMTFTPNKITFIFMTDYCLYQSTEQYFYTEIIVYTQLQEDMWTNIFLISLL